MPSLVLRATPPSVPLLGLGLTNALGLRDNIVMRVLSPRIDPPDTDDEGSIDNTLAGRQETRR